MIILNYALYVRHRVFDPQILVNLAWPTIILILYISTESCIVEKPPQSRHTWPKMTKLSFEFNQFNPGLWDFRKCLLREDSWLHGGWFKSNITAEHANTTFCYCFLAIQFTFNKTPHFLNPWENDIKYVSRWQQRLHLLNPRTKAEGWGSSLQPCQVTVDGRNLLLLSKLKPIFLSSWVFYTHLKITTNSERAPCCINHLTKWKRWNIKEKIAGITKIWKELEARAGIEIWLIKIVLWINNIGKYN